MNNQLNQLVQEREERLAQEKEEQNLAQKKAYAERFYRTSAQFRNELEATRLIELLGLDLTTIHTENQDATTVNWRMRINGSVTLVIDGQETVIDTRLQQEYYSNDLVGDTRLVFMHTDATFGDFLKTSLFEVNDETIARYAVQAIAKIRQARRKAQEIEQRDQLRSQYEQSLADYKTSCQQWAEAETARLWQPWEAWMVRYTPSFYNDRRHEGDFVEFVVTRTDLNFIVTSAVGPQIEEIDEDNGTVKDRVIACFLDATPKIFETSSITEPLAYHRHVKAGDFIVNVPPHVLSDPVAPPTEPTRPEGLGYDIPF